MRRQLIVAVLLVGLTSAACGDDASTEIDFTYPGTVYAVAVGDEFTVTLESNATTGFGWSLEEQPPARVLELVDDVYVAPDTDLAGAPGRQELTFRAVGDGSTYIQLWYIRPWDDPPAPDARARYEVIVGTGPPDEEDAIDLLELVTTEPTGEMTVRALLYDDGTGLVMCEVMAESYPPRCMGQRVEVANPGAVDADFTQQDEIRWTDRVTVLVGTYFEGVFTVSAD
jgi:inhibitor of cysteine peptidase